MGVHGTSTDNTVNPLEKARTAQIRTDRVQCPGRNPDEVEDQASQPFSGSSGGIQ